MTGRGFKSRQARHIRLIAQGYPVRSLFAKRLLGNLSLRDARKGVFSIPEIGVIY